MFDNLFLHAFLTDPNGGNVCPTATERQTPTNDVATGVLGPFLVSSKLISRFTVWLDFPTVHGAQFQGCQGGESDFWMVHHCANLHRMGLRRSIRVECESEIKEETRRSEASKHHVGVHMRYINDVTTNYNTARRQHTTSIFDSSTHANDLKQYT